MIEVEAAAKDEKPEEGWCIVEFFEPSSGTRLRRIKVKTAGTIEARHVIHGIWKEATIHKVHSHKPHA